MMRRLILSLVLVMMCAMAAPQPAKAFDPFASNTNCVGKSQASAACTADGSDPISGPKGILLRVTRIVAFFGGAIAIIMILVGAIRFITSGTDLSTGSRTDTDVEEAKSTIASALIGLVVIILAQAIITYVIEKL